MKAYFIKSLLIICFIFCCSVSSVYSWPTGVSFKTRKTTSLGCSNCHHYGTYSNAVFSGPDTVIKGQSVQFTITINRLSSGKAGIDIAAFSGLLDTAGGGTYLKIKDGELTHKEGITISGTSISINFLYIAPNYVGQDTLYATLNVGYVGNWCWVPNKIIHIRQSIGIVNISEPVNYELFQNYPNPFNPGTVISYSLKNNTFVNLCVYNIEGKLISTLVNGFQKSGKYSVPFSVSDYGLSSGVYYYRLLTDESSETKSMLLLK
jgi:hypothetical protein